MSPRSELYENHRIKGLIRDKAQDNSCVLLALVIDNPYKHGALLTSELKMALRKKQY